MKNLNELQYLYERSIAIVDYMLSLEVNDIFLQQMRAIIEKTFAEGHLKGMRTLSRDVNAWAKGLPQSKINELETILRQSHGETLSGDKPTHQVLASTLRIGKIEDALSCRIVSEYLQDIQPGDSYFENVDELRKMLSEYIGNPEK